jgi:hypothetical protein
VEIKMKLSAMELILIIDTLNGSLSVKDRGMVWTFDEKQRESVKNKLQDMMNEMRVNVEIENKEQ